MNCILVFARAPEPGQVKTRLAAQIGPEAAAHLYRAMLQDTLAVAEKAAREIEAEVTLCFTPDDAFAPGAYSLAELWRGQSMAQIGNDLGGKMRFALQNCFKAGAKRVVIIGSDKPDLEGSALRRAFEELAQHDIVLGPAHDGGFYLLGARAALPKALFANVIWSHNLTLQVVLNNADALNLSVALLSPGADLDEADDLQQFATDPELQNKAPHFYAALCLQKLI